jgi:hypothetical protein
MIRLSKAEARKLGLTPKPSKRRRMGGEHGRSPGAALFVAACKAHGLPEPEPEYRFCEARRWRLDWCFVDYWLAVEIQGGLWVAGGGRHQRGAALLAEYEKLNMAALMGYRVLFATPAQVKSGEIFPIIARALS